MEDVLPRRPPNRNPPLEDDVLMALALLPAPGALSCCRPPVARFMLLSRLRLRLVMFPKLPERPTVALLSCPSADPAGQAKIRIKKHPRRIALLQSLVVPLRSIPVALDHRYPRSIVPGGAW